MKEKETNRGLHSKLHNPLFSLPLATKTRLTRPFPWIAHTPDSGKTDTIHSKVLHFNPLKRHVLIYSFFNAEISLITTAYLTAGSRANGANRRNQQASISLGFAVSSPSSITKAGGILTFLNPIVPRHCSADYSPCESPSVSCIASTSNSTVELRNSPIQVGRSFTHCSPDDQCVRFFPVPFPVHPRGFFFEIPPANSCMAPAAAGHPPRIFIHPSALETSNKVPESSRGQRQTLHKPTPPSLLISQTQSSLTSDADATDCTVAGRK